MNSKNSEIIIYQTDDGKTRIDVRMENETVWLAQAECEKYRQKTQNDLSPAERDFLTSIKSTQKKLEGSTRKKKGQRSIMTEGDKLLSIVRVVETEEEQEAASNGTAD